MIQEQYKISNEMYLQNHKTFYVSFISYTSPNPFHMEAIAGPAPETQLILHWPVRWMAIYRMNGGLGSARAGASITEPLSVLAHTGGLSSGPLYDVYVPY